MKKKPSPWTPYRWWLFSPATKTHLQIYDVFFKPYFRKMEISTTFPSTGELMIPDFRLPSTVPIASMYGIF